MSRRSKPLRNHYRKFTARSRVRSKRRGRIRKALVKR